jgi:uncharacterized OB-fold protein
VTLESKFSEVAENELYSLAYSRFVSENKLVGAKCKSCRHISIPPKPICPKCQGSEMELVNIKGKGKLAAYTVIAVGASLMAEEGFDRQRPYCTGVVELDEGGKVTARILGVDVTKPEQIKIGAPVAVEYVRATHGAEEKTFLAFRAVPPS